MSGSYWPCLCDFVWLNVAFLCQKLLIFWLNILYLSTSCSFDRREQFAILFMTDNLAGLVNMLMHIRYYPSMFLDISQHLADQLTSLMNVFFPQAERCSGCDTCLRTFGDNFIKNGQRPPQTVSSDAFLKQPKGIDKKIKLCYYFYICSLQHASLIILSLVKMLKQEESLILDERYRQMIEEDVPTGGSFNFEEAMTVLTSSQVNIDNQHRAAIFIRKYISGPTSRMSFQHLKKLIVRSVQLSHQQQYLQLRYQALLTLTHISCRFMHPQVAKNGVIQLFFMLIHHKNVQLSRLAMFAIGNIAVGIHWRVIGQEGFWTLLEFQKVLNDEKTNEFLLWALASLMGFFRKKVKLQVVIALLPVYNNAPSYVSQLWAYCLMYFFKKDKLNIIFESGTVSCYVKYLQSQNEKLVNASLRLITMIIEEGEQFIEKLIDLGLIGQITKLLEKDSPLCNKIPYILSSLFLFVDNTCKKLLVEDFILRKLLALPSKDPQSIDIKVEVCKFFSKIIPFVNSFELYSLYKQHNFLSFFLGDTEPRFIYRLIQTLPVVLELGEKFKENGKNVFLETLKEKGALEKWENHFSSKNELLVNTLFIIFSRFVDP